MNEKEYRDFTEKELKWIKSFQRIMKKAPSTLFMFVTGDINIHTLDENYNFYMDEFGSVDNESPFIKIKTGMMVDGGDY